MNTKTIRFKKLHPDASVPHRQNDTDAGADLRCVESYVLMPLSRKLIRTGISIEIPESYYGRIAPRSGLALKHGVDVMAGVIDSSYRGEICVVLYNSDPYESIEIKKGSRIAQLIIEKHYNLPFEEVDSLAVSARADCGFGSSGIT